MFTIAKSLCIGIFRMWGEKFRILFIVGTSDVYLIGYVSFD